MRGGGAAHISLFNEFNVNIDISRIAVAIMRNEL